MGAVKTVLELFRLLREVREVQGRVRCYSARDLYCYIVGFLDGSDTFDSCYITRQAGLRDKVEELNNPPEGRRILADWYLLYGGGNLPIETEQELKQVPAGDFPEGHVWYWLVTPLEASSYILRRPMRRLLSHNQLPSVALADYVEEMLDRIPWREEISQALS